jgi:hypothetical protein
MCGAQGYAGTLMVAYLDCFACACLIRASEPSCPFCGASQRVVSSMPPRLGVGLALGLGLAVFGCGDDAGKDSVGEASSLSVGNDTPGNDSQEADAVTYAGPDPWDTTQGPDPTQGHDTIGNDSQEADAVTYAGPDESTTIGDASTTDATTSSTTDDSQEADAVTYAGPDETESAGSTG